MSKIRAVIVDPNAPGRLAISEVDAPQAASNEAIVRVSAISLNRGEVRGAASAPHGQRVGWDIAGTVEQAAADGSGPKAGARVVGMTRPGGWAEIVSIPTDSVAELPVSVTFQQAATLPVAGLTALHALNRGGNLLGRSVLVTGASGGVGDFAVQLARAAGMYVVGVTRQQSYVALVKEAGADEVVVSEDAASAAQFGPYYLIVDGSGGKVLANALTMLAPGGTCVVFGASAGPEVTFDVPRFFRLGGTVVGFLLFNDLKQESAAIGLQRLSQLIAQGRLRPHIEVEASWTEIGSVAQKLMDRAFAGKAVLTVGQS